MVQAGGRAASIGRARTRSTDWLGTLQVHPPDRHRPPREEGAPPDRLAL